MLSLKCKAVLTYARSEKFSPHLLYPTKPPEDALHGPEGVDHDTGRCGIQEAGNPTHREGKGFSGRGGRKIPERQLQRTTNPV